MRLVATEYLSLDGIFEEPGHWSGPFFTDDAARFKWDELQASDALCSDGRPTRALQRPGLRCRAPVSSAKR